MAYIGQEGKAKIAANLKPVLKKYGVKGTLRVRSNHAIVLTLKSGKIDFIGNSNRVCSASHYQTANGFRPNTEGYCSINPFWYQEHYDGDAKAFIDEAMAALKSADWYDESDPMIDYFRTAYYVDLNIGKWNKPYEVTK